MPKKLILISPDSTMILAEFLETDLVEKAHLTAAANLFPLDELCELNCAAAVETRAMGSFGLGGFARSPIKSGQILIYSGETYALGADHIPSPYAIQSEHRLIDPGVARCPAHYLQHLPDRHGDEEIATANFELSEIYVPVGDKFLYLIILVANRDISAGELLGWNHSNDIKLWELFGERPVYFRPDGTFYSYQFSFKIQSHDDKPLMFCGLTHRYFSDPRGWPIAGLSYKKLSGEESNTYLLSHFSPEIREAFTRWAERMNNTPVSEVETLFCPAPEINSVPLVLLELLPESVIRLGRRKPTSPLVIIFFPNVEREALRQEFERCRLVYAGCDLDNGALIMREDALSSPEKFASMGQSTLLRGSTGKFMSPSPRHTRERALKAYSQFPPTGPITKVPLAVADSCCPGQ